MKRRMGFALLGVEGVNIGWTGKIEESSLSTRDGDEAMRRLKVRCSERRLGRSGVRTEPRPIPARSAYWESRTSVRASRDRRPPVMTTRGRGAGRDWTAERARREKREKKA